MAKTYNTIPSVATGDVLTATGWNNQATNVNNYRVPPMCMVYRTAVQAVANTTWVVPTFDGEVYDTDDMHSLSVNTNRITINTAGLYLVTVTGYWNSSSTTGSRYATVTRNATTDDSNGPHIGSTYNEGAGSAYQRINMSNVSTFAVGDWITLHLYQSSGGSINLSGAATASGGFLTGPLGYLPGITMSATWLGQVS